MKKFILIIPYFGTLPPYFPAFVHSVENLDEGAKILFITDDDSIDSYPMPSCISVRRMSFREMQSRVEKRLGGILPTGYKLCDYKPTFGVLFSEDIEGYAFWGYCDIDTMLGDVCGFLDRMHYDKYDRIGDKGHFTLYRNTKQINELFWRKNNSGLSFSYVRQTSYPCNFDECGMNQICVNEGIRFLPQNYVLAIEDHKSLHFHTYNQVYSCLELPTLVTWSNGHIYLIEKEHNELRKTEFMYLHFEGRKSLRPLEPLGQHVLLTHEGIYNYDESCTMDIIDAVGRSDTQDERIAFQKEIRKRSRLERRNKFFREVSVCGWRTIPNLAIRLLTVLKQAFGN